MAKTNQDKNTRKHTGKGRGSDSNGSAIQNMRTLWNEMNSEPSDTTGQGMSRGELIRFGFGAILFLVSCFILLSIASHLVTAGADDGFPKYEGARAANWMGEWGLYTARFFNKEENDPLPDPEPEIIDEEPKTFEELFIEEE